MENSRPLIALAALVLIASLLCCCCCVGGLLVQRPDSSRVRGPDVIAPPSVDTATATPPVTETLTPAPTPGVARDLDLDLKLETEAALREAVIPVRDLHDLAIRLRGLPADLERTVNPEGPPDYEVGTRRLFHATDVDTEERFQLYATLRYRTDHVYMWVEEDVRVDQSALEAAADLFETRTYVTNREFFGSEWKPGVDNDPRLSILHATNLGKSVAGYYSSADQFVAAVREDSNEMEMFYINIDNVRLNSDFYNGVLAHEFQHMIHWYNDRNEETWLNEGFSELAVRLNGFNVGSDRLFADAPDTQLNSWPSGPGVAGPNYGAGYLFTSYFLDRFGPDATRALVAHPENSFASVDAVLEDLGTGLSYEDLYADWVIANMLDDPSIHDGRYGYQDIVIPPFRIGSTYGRRAYPVSKRATVNQHGTDYIELQGTRPLTFSFSGSTQVKLIDTAARSGRYVWWSNRGDDSNMTLTQPFDLSDVSRATLSYWTWYDIEENWDYAYLEVSTDGGETWQILAAPSSVDTNPNGNSFGWAYTGVSGSGDEPEWIREDVDLSDFTGQEIKIRFEYITDDAVHRPGLALDDIRIPEIGYGEDFEADGGGWEAAGFIRHANVLLQRWLVQLITFGPETTVERLEVGDGGTGSWTIPLNWDTDRAIIAVSALAPVTTETATYRYEVTEQ